MIVKAPLQRKTILGMAAAIALALTALPTSASASTVTVNKASDAPDLRAGDGRCDTAKRRGLQCSLRAAITESNRLPKREKIAFDLGSGRGVQTIKPRKLLPEITDPVTIDGFSQPGSRPNTLASGSDQRVRVVLDGTAVSLKRGLHRAERGLPRVGGDPTIGLYLVDGKSSVRGLSIGGFTYGVAFGTDSDGSKLTGCFIGVLPSGTTALPNDNGIVSAGAGITVGGQTAASRNLISGNEAAGIFLFATEGAKVEGNLIGTDRSGSAALPNRFGVWTEGGNYNQIGGYGTAGANVIGFNDANGITVWTGHSNSILINSIHDNGFMGINLGDPGNEPNDAGDVDVGPNGLQNRPVVSEAKRVGLTATTKSKEPWRLPPTRTTRSTYSRIRRTRTSTKGPDISA